MDENVREKARELLEKGSITGFLGLSMENGHIGPRLFREADELTSLVVGDGAKAGDSRYPLTGQLVRLARAYPEDTFGVMVRGCDERALRSLMVWNQLNPERVLTVGIACPQELADACECEKPYPDEFVAGEKAEKGSPVSVTEIEGLDSADRFAFWMDEFAKCIKCYGCRDICPVCFCKECSLDDHSLVLSGEIPPEIPSFHLIRAVHMAGRCIDCGLCSEACPADIPLRTLYKKVAEIIDREFEFRPGYDMEQKSPLNNLWQASEE